MKCDIARANGSRLFYVEILEVENGYIITDGGVASGPFQAQKYVAYNADELALLVKRLANEFKAQLSMGDT